MKKLLLALLLLTSPALAQNNVGSVAMWEVPADPGNEASNEIGSAAVYYAMGFVAPAGKTVSKIKWACDYKGGTLGASDVGVYLYSATVGKPNVSLQSSTSTCSGTDTWNEATGFSTALTAGNQYYIVLRNLNGTPATNYFAVARRNDMGGFNAFGRGTSSSSTAYGNHVSISNDSGSTWTSGNFAGAGQFRIEFSDASFFGVPIYNSVRPADNTGSGESVYSTREVGNKFTTPSDAKIRISGIGCWVYKNNTPTADIRFGLWTGVASPTNIAYTATLPVNQISGQGFVNLPFATVQELTAATAYRITMGRTTQSDTSSNTVTVGRDTWENDANSLLLKPMGGTLSKTYFDGATWTDTTTQTVWCTPYLQYGDEFGTQASGGLRNQNQISGGAQ